MEKVLDGKGSFHSFWTNFDRCSKTSGYRMFPINSYSFKVSGRRDFTLVKRSEEEFFIKELEITIRPNGIFHQFQRYDAVEIPGYRTLSAEEVFETLKQGWEKAVEAYSATLNLETVFNFEKWKLEAKHYYLEKWGSTG